MHLLGTIALGFLCGLLGLVVGWVGIATLVIAIAGMGNDGGKGMSAIFLIGPVGGLVGFVIGVVVYWMFRRSRRRLS